MNYLSSPHAPLGLAQPPGGRACPPPPAPFAWYRRWRRACLAFLAGWLVAFGIAPAARAQQTPPGCTGSGLGINLFTSSPDVHIGDTISYSISVFNGSAAGPVVCDAIDIVAGIVTPDGKTNLVTLVRRTLHNGEADFYPDAVSYVVRAQDIRPDGSVRATAFDDGTILQNDTPSRGGSDQGVNTEVSQPCIGIQVACLGTAGENGRISFSGAVTNCGNNTLVGVTVTSVEDNGAFRLVFTNNILRGEVVTFTGSFEPLNPCTTDTVTLTATGVDQFTSNPRTVTASASTSCGTVLTPALLVTRNCPAGPVRPGQLLVFAGTVRNSGNVTLTNVTVVSDQPAPNTVVLTLASLAPGVTADYTGSYLAPAACVTTGGVIANGTSICGVPVSDSASSTCTILTTPLIAVTTVCSTNAAVPGGVQTYAGTVRNTGDIALKDVVVKSDRPAANTTVFTVATLAPGASANFAGTYNVPLLDACSVTTTVIATGLDVCTDVGVSATSTVTCGVATAPAIAVTLSCPVVPPGVGGAVTYLGTVRNSGDVTLLNVSVRHSLAGPEPVFTVASLAPGATAAFTASVQAPTNACTVTGAVVAVGSDGCSALSVTNGASATCTLTTHPALAVTQSCPPETAVPGGLFTYGGTVRNVGDITLTNVVVTDDRNRSTGVTNTVLWVDDQVPAGARLAGDGGDSWNFIRENPAPFTGTNAHQSNLGAGVHTHSFVSAAAGLAVGVGDVLVAAVHLDSGNIPSEVMLQWNDGTWEHRAYWGANRITNQGVDGTASRRHMGPLPIAGQWVKLEVPAALVGLEGRTITGMAFTLFDGRATWDAAGKVSAAEPTQVFAVARLLPGESAGFTGSFTLPLDVGCSITTVLNARADDTCDGTQVAATSTGTCPVLTTPGIEVTQTCPAELSVQGGLLTYSGTVRNSGNTTLTNVTVRNSRTGGAPILTLASLAPGDSAPFTGTYVVPLNCCTVSSTATAAGADACTGRIVADTATSTCLVSTSPALAVTKQCPLLPAVPGEAFHYTGTVSNSGNITLVDVYVINSRTGADAPVIGPLTLAPGESADFTGTYVYVADYCGTDTLTAFGLSMCEAPVTGSITTTCLAEPTVPGIEVTKSCPLLPTPYGALYTYTGTVRNTGNVTLVDVFVVNNQPSNATPVIGPITLAPGASVDFSSGFLAPMDCCEITDTVTASGRDRCAGTVVMDKASTVCPLLTTPGLSLAKVCTTPPAPLGGEATFSGSVTNTGNVNLTNVMVFSGAAAERPLLGPIELAPGESAQFNGSYLVTTNDAEAEIVTARGTDTCQARTVTAKANCSGPVGLTAPVIRSVSLASGVVTVVWDATPGLTYTLQCKGNAEDPVWIDIPGNVTAGQVITSKTDSVGPTPRRFYRVIVAE